MARPPTPSELDRLIRYCHPAKILALTRLPGLETLDDRTLAALYGVEPARYRATAAAMAREAADAARQLRHTIAPPAVSGPVLAVGDSLTDDLASWAEVLGALLEVPVINAGVSGETTAAVRSRVTRLPPAAHAFVLAATNDARRHDGDDMLVSNAETRRNIRAIDRALRRTCSQVTWITPPPVDERRIGVDPALAAAGVTWRLADVAAKAAAVRHVSPAAIDLWPTFRADHLAGDGLHPSAPGQRLIADHVCRRLGRHEH